MLDSALWGNTAGATDRPIMHVLQSREDDCAFPQKLEDVHHQYYNTVCPILEPEWGCGRLTAYDLKGSSCSSSNNEPVFWY